MESTTLNINLAAQIYGDVYHTVIADITFNVPVTSPPHQHFSRLFFLLFLMFEVIFTLFTFTLILDIH
jgi:hypothetical protein